MAAHGDTWHTTLRWYVWRSQILAKCRSTINTGVMTRSPNHKLQVGMPHAMGVNNLLIFFQVETCLFSAKLLIVRIILSLSRFITPFTLGIGQSTLVCQALYTRPFLKNRLHIPLKMSYTPLAAIFRALTCTFLSPLLPPLFLHPLPYQ